MAEVCNSSPNIIVIDTSVLFISPQPWQVPELSVLRPVSYIIPATTLFELDRLMERADTRDRARASRNALKPLVDRGATQRPITCGSGATVRIASGDEESPHTGLDMNLADDRILAVAIGLKDKGPTVSLATTEFALYAKALTMGVGGVLVETPEPPPSQRRISRKERELFWSSWQKVNDAESLAEIYDRATQFAGQALVQRLLADAVRTGQPQRALLAFQRLRQAETSGSASASLPLLGIIFGVGLAPKVNSSTEFVLEYSDNLSTPRTRSETGPERALRLESEQRALQQYEVSVIGAIRKEAQVIRDHIMELLGDDLD